MDKDKKIFLGIILLLLVFMVFVGIIAFRDKKIEDDNKPTSVSEDAIKFKEEYESLNGVVNESNGKKTKELSISTTNPVDILTEEETISLLEDGTGILYLGFPECPWCRSMLPVLLNTLDNTSIDKLYYLNIYELRSVLELNKKNKVEVVRKGTDSYYKMLELMDEYLEPYYLTSEDDKKIDTKEKRIYAPTVVAIKDGEIKGIHVSTIDSQKDPYKDLTKKQENELSSIFMDLINEVYDVSCDEAC